MPSALSNLEIIMTQVSTSVKLMDTRLLLITDRLNNLSDRQERVEASVKLLYDCIRQLQVPTSQAQPHSLPQAQPVPPQELSLPPPLPPMEQEQQQEPHLLPEQPQPTQPGAQPFTPNCSTPAESTCAPMVFTGGSSNPQAIL